MSELDLPAMVERDKKEDDRALTSSMKEINEGLKACKFGRFHIKLLSCSFVGIVAGVLVSNSTAYLLPSAECDLKMNLVQKGLLNAMPYFGTLISSVVAGFLTDTFGRKMFLFVGFGGEFIFMIISGSSQTFEVLVISKFCEGLLFATSFGAVLTLTSEFCHNEIRDRVVLFQTSFVAIAQILIASMAWGILINDWKLSFFDGKFVLNTWNFYLYAMSLWSLAGLIMYVLLLPESPKYLLTQKKYDEAREILIKIYRENTGKPADTYPYYNLWRDKTKCPIDETPEQEVKATLGHQIIVGLHNTKPMFRKPLVVYLGLICLINFLVMSMCNVFRLWFPQISAIVENSQMQGSEDLCVLLDEYTTTLNAATKNATTEVCVAARSGDETYINSIIIGIISLFPFLLIGVLVNKIGKKPLFIGASLLSVAGTTGLRWASSKAAIVSLFSINIALAQIMISISQAIIVEIFPTTSRTLAVSLMMVSGRIGTLTGNISFPFLLNMGCIVPFYTISGTMVCVTVILLFLPIAKK